MILAVLIVYIYPLAPPLTKIHSSLADFIPYMSLVNTINSTFPALLLLICV